MFSVRADVDAAMAGRMAGCRRKPKRVVELIIIFDEQRLSSLNHGLAIVAPHIATTPWPIFAAFGRLLPTRIFALVENIFGLRKGWHPAAIAQDRIPTTMVDMQVRAEHVIDVFEAQAGCLEAVQPWLLRKVHGRLIALVLAGAGID